MCVWVSVCGSVSVFVCVCVCVWEGVVLLTLIHDNNSKLLPPSDTTLFVAKMLPVRLSFFLGDENYPFNKFHFLYAFSNSHFSLKFDEYFSDPFTTKFPRILVDTPQPTLS